MQLLSGIPIEPVGADGQRDLCLGAGVEIVGRTAAAMRVGTQPGSTALLKAVGRSRATAMAMARAVT